MRRKASAALRLEHMICQHIFFGERPIGPDLCGIHVLIHVRAGDISDRNAIEPIHLPMVVILNPVQVAVVGRNLAFEVALFQESRSIVRPSPACAIGAGECSEQIIESAVLLNDNHDVREVLALLRWR
jgi:hypothetical protein